VEREGGEGFESCEGEVMEWSHMLSTYYTLYPHTVTLPVLIL